MNAAARAAHPRSSTLDRWYPELVHIAERTLGDDVVVRDHGLLESALTRPQATVFGADAYG